MSAQSGKVETSNPTRTFKGKAATTQLTELLSEVHSLDEQIELMEEKEVEKQTLVKIDDEKPGTYIPHANREEAQLEANVMSLRILNNVRKRRERLASGTDS